MRIIAGKLGGRSFESPKSKRTHPMSERVRGGLFNSLGNIDGMTVLDAFAGSAALSFEAASRGASHVTAIEIDRKASKVIKDNVNLLDLQDKIKVVSASCGAWSDNNSARTFDIVLSAPPYDDIKIMLLQKLTMHVEKGGMYILDWPGKLMVPEFEGLEMLKRSDYGDSQLVFYRKTG